MRRLTEEELLALDRAQYGTVRVVIPGWSAGPGDIPFAVAQPLLAHRPPLLRVAGSAGSDPAALATVELTSAGRRVSSEP